MHFSAHSDVSGYQTQTVRTGLFPGADDPDVTQTADFQKFANENLTPNQVQTPASPLTGEQIAEESDLMAIQEDVLIDEPLIDDSVQTED